MRDGLRTRRVRPYRALGRRRSPRSNPRTADSVECCHRVTTRSHTSRDQTQIRGGPATRTNTDLGPPQIATRRILRKSRACPHKTRWGRRGLAGDHITPPSRTGNHPRGELPSALLEGVTASVATAGDRGGSPVPEVFLAGRAIARTLSINFSLPVVLARNAWVRQLDGRVEMEHPRPRRPRASGSGAARSGAPSRAR